MTYIYNKSTTSKILGINPEEIQYISVGKEILIAKLINGETIPIEIEDYLEYFYLARYERGKNIKFSKVGNHYAIYKSVRNGETKTYKVTKNKCDCKDFRLQKEAGLKNPKCKHIMAFQELKLQRSIA